MLNVLIYSNIFTAYTFFLCSKLKSYAVNRLNVTAYNCIEMIFFIVFCIVVQFYAVANILNFNILYSLLHTPHRISNLTKLVFEGATKGDASIELVKLEGSKFKQLQFNKDFTKVYTEQLKKSNLKAKFRETGDPLVQLYAGSETKSNLLLQIRVKVEAASSNSKDGKVYRPYMRNYVEAGPLMFALLN